MGTQTKQKTENQIMTIIQFEPFAPRSVKIVRERQQRQHEQDMINSSRSARVVREASYSYQAVNRMQRETRVHDMILDDIATGAHRAQLTIDSILDRKDIQQMGLARNKRSW